MLRIGVDCRSLFSKNISGIGRYTTESLRHLVQYPAHFYLYGLNPTDKSNWSNANTSLRLLRHHNRLNKLLWLQIYLPYQAYKDNLDVFWGPSHRMPYCLSPNIARVLTIHDLVWKHAASAMKPSSRLTEAILMPQAIESSDLIVTISKSTAHDISKAYPKAIDKIRVIYPGHTPLPAIDDVHVLTNFKISSPYILFVSTLEPRKNINRLMRAFASLKEENKNISLVIAGGKGWGDVNITQWINEYGLNGRVIPVGHVTNEQLATLYANSLFLAMPSLYEGFGLPIVEAMSFGKAVLTSNISSMPEVAGEAAVLVDPLDEHSIAMGLRLLLNKNERNKLAIKAKQTANRFTWQANAKQLLEVFHEATAIRKQAMRSNN